MRNKIHSWSEAARETAQLFSHAHQGGQSLSFTSETGCAVKCTLPAFLSSKQLHALYGEHEAQYNIATLDTIRGSLPRRAHALVVEWASLHKVELMKNWERCQIPAPAVPIEPLE